MNLWLIPLAVTVAWLTTGPAQAQEKYTIKLKELGKGDSSRVQLLDSQTFKNITTIEKEKGPKTEDTQRTKQVVYVETILEQPDANARPTSLKRVYEKAIDKSTFGADKREVAQPYSGKIVLIEKKGDKYEFRIDGGAKLEKGVLELDIEFNGPVQPQQKKTFVPPGPVAVDETWTIDPKGFLGDLDKDGKTDVVKSDGKAKLVKVYKKDGRLYGVIDATVDLHIKSKAKGPGDIDMTSTLKITLDACIDGSMADGRMTGTLQFKTTAKLLDPYLGTVTNNSTGTGTIDQSWQELPKK